MDVGTTKGCGRRATLVALAASSSLAATPSAATDLHYVLMSPNFGGTDASAVQMAQYDQTLKAARAAAAAAAAKNATPTDPSQAFVNAILSQLNGIVAQTIAQKIANSSNGQAGTIRSGSVTVTYVNADGQLTVTITTPSGSTTLTIPSGTA